LLGLTRHIDVSKIWPRLPLKRLAEGLKRGSADDLVKRFRLFGVLAHFAVEHGRDVIATRAKVAANAE
jgi:hypothetical protein